MLCVTGDCHGEPGRFLYMGSEIERNLTYGDMLFICGDFGYVKKQKDKEPAMLDIMAEKPYQILFVDGNHENFDLLEQYPVEEWCGGKVRVIRRDADGKPKILHLMRGQVFEMEGKKIFTFGGAYSFDKFTREPHVDWWPQEMPTEEEMDAGMENLAKHGYQVDYILTHAAPEDTMSMFHPYHPEEARLNVYLEVVREKVRYDHWYFGHLHMDRNLARGQTVLWFDVRNMETNELLE